MSRIRSTVAWLIPLPMALLRSVAGALTKPTRSPASGRARALLIGIQPDAGGKTGMTARTKLNRQGLIVTASRFHVR